MTQGSCNCGRVKFHCSTNIRDVYICHCSICRKSTGSAGIAVSIILNDDFKWIQGKELITTWEKPGHDWQTSFCSRCGSPLPGQNDDIRTYIPVSLLDTGAVKLKIKH
ncbi:GFA family protein [Alteromonas sp. ASW11-130]|uniref:GFA family protein n=1 Tax=Alteromonas sp. ASW11-130 TaxID=3015775 RepID=UPI0022423E1B|nr:GFA family protein [Alteromonas sp. ASW11-130]MCW8090409.1 GFA family protein [Alteromonas sp. ASW11-130]